jgi:DNA-directed RNA polymerase subunit D
MIAEVPTMAVEYVDFSENNSALFDEVVAHRMGMIPLEFDPRKFNFTQDCKCKGKGCPSCEVVFVINRKGPAIIYSGDLKSSNKDVKPTSPTFPIVELLNGQLLKFEAVARLGIGKNHIKWQAANASYQYYPELKESGDNPKRAASSCPKNVLEVKGEKLSLNDPLGCDLCRACEAAGAKVQGNQNKFIFYVESVSGLKPEYIISQACEILQAKAKEFKSEFNKIK